MRPDELLNASGLDESITKNYNDNRVVKMMTDSNGEVYYGAIGNPLKGIGDKARGTAKRIREAAQRAAKKAKEAADRAKKKAKEAADRAKKAAEDARNNATQTTKALAEKAKKAAEDAHKEAQKAANHANDQIKKAGKNIKTTVKKVAKSIKDKVGEIGKALRNKLRGFMRRGILFNIKNNIHGLAVRLYPAIATEQEVSSQRFKKSYVGKTKNIYSQLVKRWTDLGGTESELQDAIKTGNSKRRFLKSPYKSADGTNNSFSFYSYMSALSEPKLERRYWSADGEEVKGESDTDSTDEEYIEEEYVEEEVPTEQDKQKGIRGFFAWLMGLFKKNKADENPYEDGSLDSTEWNTDATEDIGNEPSESEANNEILAEIEKMNDADDAGGETDESANDESEDEDEDDDDKILGIPKPAFWIGVSVIGLSAIGLTIWLIKRNK